LFLCFFCVFVAIYIHVVFLSWFCAVWVAVWCVCCVSCMNSSLSFNTNPVIKTIQMNGRTMWFDWGVKSIKFEYIFHLVQHAPNACSVEIHIDLLLFTQTGSEFHKQRIHSFYVNVRIASLATALNMKLSDFYTLHVYT